MSNKIPVDNYIKEDHYEDCAIPASACSVDYYQQYEIKEESNESSIHSYTSRQV